MRDRYIEREAYRDDPEQFRGGAAAWAVLACCVLIIVLTIGTAAWWSW